MFKGLIGKKVGMTQIFDVDGVAIPITLIEAGPCFVTQVRTAEHDGYQAVQLGFGEVKPKRLTGGELGHLKRNSLPPLRFIREFRAKDPQVKEGETVNVSVFAVGERVDVIGVSKGKGFQGGVKRYHFKGGPRTHGQSDRERALARVVPQQPQAASIRVLEDLVIWVMTVLHRRASKLCWWTKNATC